MTQEELIHSHLINHGSISSWEAIQIFRITRLSAYILNLRKMGIDIKDKWESNLEGKRWKKYYIEKGSNESTAN